MTPELLALKRATGAVVKGVGGLEEAARRCRIGKSTLGDNQSVNHPESFMAIDVVMALEPLTRGRDDWPAVTRELCLANGGVFVELPEAVDDAAVEASVFDLVERLGAVSREVRVSRADDGEIDRAERAKIRARLTDMDMASASLRKALAHLDALEAKA